MSARPLVRRLHLLVALVLRLLVVAAAGAGVAAGGAHAASSAEYLGVNTQPLVKDATIAPTEWGRYFDQLQSGNLNVDRVQISWMTVEPVAPVNGVHTYRWNVGGAGSRDSVDYLMTQMAQRGLRAAPLFATVPSWSSSNSYRMTAASYPDFAAFIAAFAQRYGPGGAFWSEHPELAALPVYDYEIWTEANSTNFWTGSPNPAEYAAAMKVISPALHAAQPAAKLLASIGWQDVVGYVNAFWAAGGGSAIDGIGYHPYAPHGPAIIGLVTRLRTTLTALGVPSMPIYVTESGQPVVMSGTGASSAGSGLVTDAARAATHEFAADVLARSNCGSEQYLIYAITGSETNREPISEGYMGIFRHADGAPYLTGAAAQRAATRWHNLISSGQRPGVIGACDSLTTNDQDLLPLGLVLTKTGDTCVNGVVTYDGNPLEGATLEFRATGRAYGQSTNAFGRNQVCLTSGVTVTSFQVFAQVANMARSSVYECDLPITSCEIVSAAPDAPGTPDVSSYETPSGSTLLEETVAGSSAAATANGCTWTVAGKGTNTRVRGRKYVKVRAKLTCANPGTYAGRKYRFRIAVRRKVTVKTTSTTKNGTKKTTTKTKTRDHYLRTVKLRAQRTVTFKVRLNPRTGDRLLLLHRASTSKSDTLPKVQQLFTLKPFKH
ncbi:MAG: hypothetical protein QM679_09825 [Patulibacter sp.]